MAVIYTGMTLVDDTTLVDGLESFFVNTFDGIYDAIQNGASPEINFGILKPGPASTVNIGYTFIKSDDDVLVKLGDAVVGLLEGATATLLATAAVVLLAPELVAVGAIASVAVVGAVVIAGLATVLEPVVNYTIGGNLTDVWEFLTSTQDDKFTLYDADGVTILGEALYKSGLGSTSAIDAAADLVHEAFYNPELGAPVAGAKIDQINDSGNVTDSYKS
ncbi:MAG TPA: hypothetical protein EYP39_08885 [Ghiorsea sp.]|nr:hypothetical protein [Ghiorsea sp.]